MKYNCLRCNYHTSKRSNIIDHLNRKNMCKPFQEDINLKDKIIRNKILKICDHCDKYYPNIEEHLTQCEIIKKNENNELKELVKSMHESLIELQTIYNQQKFIKFNNISGMVVDVRPRKTISKVVRRQLWDIYFSNSFTGKCYVCTKNVDYDNFEAGHIISLAHGGSDYIDNLRVVCKSCNISIGTDNMDDFIKVYLRNLNTIIQE